MSESDDGADGWGEAAAGGADDAPDVVLVGGETEGGDGARVLRMRKGSLELGELRAMREGRPIHGEIVRLRQRAEHERLFDVEVLVPAPERPERLAKGPPQVATNAYREGWDRIFGPRPTPGSNAPS